jgi:hypothetical protein
LVKNLDELVGSEGNTGWFAEAMPWRNARSRNLDPRRQDMSIKVMSLVWDHSPLKERYRFVLIALADYANESGEYYPSVQRIAKKTCLLARQTGHGLVAAGRLLLPDFPMLTVLADVCV